MLNKKISEIFNGIQGPLFWASSDMFDPVDIRKMTMDKIHGHAAARHGAARKTWRTLLIAAVLVCLLTAGAFAVGMSIHQRSQAQLRQQLKVDENNVTSYTEFETQSADGNIVLLSAIKDGEFEHVYVNISPVTKEQIINCGAGVMFWWSANGGATRSAAFPVTDDSAYTEADMETCTDSESGQKFSSVSRDAWVREMLKSYDEQTQSVTLNVVLLTGSLEYDLSKPTELSICAVTANGGDPSDMETTTEYGTVTLEPVETQMLKLYFPESVEFENPETGGHGQVIGAEIYPTAIGWLIRHDDSELIYYSISSDTSLSQDEKDRRIALSLTWLNAIDAVLNSAQLNFSDGSSFKTPVTLSADYADGVSRCNCMWDKTIDIGSIESVTIGGVTIPVVQ